jgi:hypothetical protein
MIKQRAGVEAKLKIKAADIASLRRQLVASTTLDSLDAPNPEWTVTPRTITAKVIGAHGRQVGTMDLSVSPDGGLRYELKITDEKQEEA